ncbi:cyclohexanone monooxygenase [Phyllosticta capitalensis]
MATPDVDIPNLPNGTAHKSPFTARVEHVESPPEKTPDPKYPRLVNPDGTLDDYELEDHFIDDVRPLKVAIVGTGLAGVTAGVILLHKVPKIQLTILDKNADVGGTWFENIYPGVRCDVPSVVYQSSFEPKKDWSDEFATGAEIRDYWQGIARKHSLYELTRFKTEVKRADWVPRRSQWKLTTENLDTGDVTEQHFDFFLPAIGHFNAWKIPDYPGIDTYKGFLRHSSHWDPSFDPTDKRIAIIGNGASGIQILPELRKTATRIDHYARSPTWIAGSLGGRERLPEPMPFTPEQLEAFKDDKTYLAYRKELEHTYWNRFSGVIKDGPESAAARDNFIALMAKRLDSKGRRDLLDHLVPAFAPHCRRLTPGPGYLEALAEPNVELIRAPIARFTETGIVTEDGRTREVDAVVCCTGANTHFAPVFPIVSGEHDLSRDWLPEGKFGFPYTYLGLGVPHFPNLLLLYGPSSSAVSGTIPQSAETAATYHARVLRKVSRQGYRTAAPRKEAADDFVRYADAFFPRTVFSGNCRSWYNGGRPGGRVHGIWPGSGAHLNWARRETRWEDWDWGYGERTANRFGWLGNGRMSKEFEEGADLLPWLRVPGDIDLREYHERWWEP